MCDRSPDASGYTRRHKRYITHQRHPGLAGHGTASGHGRPRQDPREQGQPRTREKGDEFRKNRDLAGQGGETRTEKTRRPQRWGVQREDTAGLRWPWRAPWRWGPAPSDGLWRMNAADSRETAETCSFVTPTRVTAAVCLPRGPSHRLIKRFPPALCLCGRSFVWREKKKKESTWISYGGPVPARWNFCFRVLDKR